MKASIDLIIEKAFQEQLDEIRKAKKETDENYDKLEQSVKDAAKQIGIDLMDLLEDLAKE